MGTHAEGVLHPFPWPEVRQAFSLRIAPIQHPRAMPEARLRWRCAFGARDQSQSVAQRSRCSLPPNHRFPASQPVPGADSASHLRHSTSVRPPHSTFPPPLLPSKIANRQSPIAFCLRPTHPEDRGQRTVSAGNETLNVQRSARLQFAPLWAILRESVIQVRSSTPDRSLLRAAALSSPGDRRAPCRWCRWRRRRACGCWGGRRAGCRRRRSRKPCCV